jgi:hypothetical protein
MGASQSADILAAVRAEFAPAPNDPAAVETRCQACGVGFWRWKGKQVRYCPACSHQRSLDATRGISEKRGPAWEATVRGQLRRWITEAECLGLIPGGTLDELLPS